MKVEVAVLGSPSLIVRTVSVDGKAALNFPRLQSSVCENRGDRPGLPVPNSPYSLCGRKATLNKTLVLRAQELCESRGRRPGLPVLIIRTVSVDVKQHWRKICRRNRRQNFK